MRNEVTLHNITTAQQISNWGEGNKSKFVKVLYSHVLQIPNQQERNDQCGKDKMLKGRKKTQWKLQNQNNENF